MVEGRFKDASYCHWVLAVEALHQQQDKRRQAFAHHNTLADLYFAYSHIHTHARQPFTKLAPHTLLQAASFLLRSLRDDPANNSNPPPGISRVHTLYAFATQAEKLGAQATARRAYDELAALQLPPAWRDAVDLRRLKLRSDETTTATDPPDLLPLCYRCGLRNPLLPTTAAADCCQGCGYPFIRSPLTLEVLALVEFAPDPAEVPSAAQALALLRATDDADTDADGGDGTQCGEGARRFNACVARALGAQQQRQQPQRQRPQPKREQLSTGQTRPRASSSSASASASVAYAPVLLGAQDLRSLRREEVFVVHGRLRSGAHEAYGQRKQRQHQHQQGTRQPGGTLLPCRYYRNVLHPDAPLALSQAAGRFFGKEAFEAAWLLAQEEEEEAEDERLVDERAEEETTTKRTEGPCCPFSRVRGVGGYGSL